jgi:putative MATE family efflux protein
MRAMEASPPATAAMEQGLWSTLREAVRGSQRDFTKGSIPRSIFLLAVPMVLELVMESVFAVVDVFVVSRLGPDAVATVGLTESLLVLVYAVAMGVSIGAMALIARRVGEKEPERAARTAVQAIVLAFLLAAPVVVVGVALAPRLLQLMGGSPWVLQNGIHYMRVMMASTLSITLLFLINAIFRGAGDAAVAMRVLWLANGINCVLAPCLVLGLGPFPRLGVVGAAVGTSIGRTSGVVYQLWRLSRPDGRITIRRRHLHIEWSTILQVLRLSGSATLQMLVGMASWVGMVRIISAFGSSALAGYTIAIRIILFALLPSAGLANAAGTLVGQNLGAKQPARAERSVWIAAGFNAGFLGLVGLLLLVFAPQLIHLFTGDATVAGYGVSCLRVVSIGFAFYGVEMVMLQALNGAGDTRTPTLINFGCFWVLELPMAWFLSHNLGLGPFGAFLALLAAFCSVAVLGTLVFRTGRWKLRVV